MMRIKQSAGSRIVLLLAVLFLGMLVAAGCGKKDDTADKAPPAGANARPDPASTDKMKRLPGAAARPGGG